MSTRATIKIKEGIRTFRVYHHSDGYPEGVGSDLKKFLKGIREWHAEELTNSIVKGAVDNDLNYEITSSQHGDEAYAYLIDCDKKKLTCYKVGWDDFEWTKDKIVDIP